MKSKTFVVGLGLVGIIAIAGAIVLLTLPTRPKQSQAAVSETSPEHHEIPVSNVATETNKVIIYEHEYVPSRIRVKKGTTVTWENQAIARHDVFPDVKSDNFVGSQLLTQGQTYSFTFNTIGTYSYYCSTHEHMKGIVEVVE